MTWLFIAAGAMVALVLVFTLAAVSLSGQISREEEGWDD